MKPHLPTALRRALLAALAVAALAPAAWAETFTLTQDTSFKCGEGDWSLGAAFKSENTAVSYTFTSNPENKYSLSFSGGTDGVFCNYYSSGSFDYLTFTQLNELSFSGNEAGSGGGAIYSGDGDITLSENGAITFFDNKFTIHSEDGDITLSDNGDISFSGNKGVIYGSGGAITLSGNTGAITFSDNKGDTEGGAIHSYGGDITLSKNSGAITFSNNKADEKGGAIYSERCDITLSDNGTITFSGNEAGGSGGAIYGDRIVFIQSENKGNITFSGNKATGTAQDGGGGAIYAYNELTINGYGSVEFSKNEAPIGGAISLGKSKGIITVSGNVSVLFSENRGSAIYGNVQFDNNTTVCFTENSSVTTGGAIDVTRTHATMSSNGEVTFLDNVAGTSGGAIDGYQSSVITLTDNGTITFSGNKAGSGGGAICSDSGAITLSENTGVITFSGNEAGTSGGAIYSESGAITLSENTEAITFSGNKAGSYGGAIYNDSGDITLSENGAITFSGNKAGENGGAIYSDSGAITLSKNSGAITFSDNEAGEYGSGGAIYSNSGAITLSENTGAIAFSSNKASLDGGAIYSDEGSITLTDNKEGITFSGNEAGYRGGAIYSYSGAITLSENTGAITFSGNTAGSWGGAIYSNSGTITLSENTGAITFFGNTAGSSGGAIYSNSGTITLSGNTGAITFSCNEAKGTAQNPNSYTGSGGAIWAYRNMTIDNNGSVEFSGNKAQSSGGVIAAGSAKGIFTVNNNGSVLFSKNIAGSNGGAIFSDAQFYNNTTVCFTENRAGSDGGALYSCGMYGSIMRSNGNVTFSNNVAEEYGGAIYSSKSTQALSFVNNDSVLFQGNVANSADPTSIQLQSLFLGESYNNNDLVSFSAPEEGSITFYDSIYVGDAVALNQRFDDDGDADTEAIAQTGTITFSGATAEADLKTYLSANNMQLSEEQLANALAASLTSEIRGTTTLYAGTLEVVDGAVLTGGVKMNSSGASVEDSYANGGLVLAEDSAATLYLRGGSIDKEVTLGETSRLKAEGENNNITALTVDEGASLTVSAYEQEGKPTVAGELTITDELVLNGTATVAEGATLSLGSITTLASAISNDGTVALAGEITLNGFTKETVYTYSAGSNSGYRITNDGYAVITGTGTTTGTATWKVGAASTTTYQDGYALFAGETAYDNYWVGSGDTIALSKAQAEDATTIAMNGGTLTVDAAFDSVTSISSVVEGASGGTVEIAANHTLNKTVLTAAADKEITLTGSGTYNLGDSLDNGAGTGVVFGAEGTWAGTVSATDAELTSGSVDTTAWQRTELNGTTTVNNGTTLTLGGDVTLKGQIANSGTLTLSGNITIDVASFADGTVTELAPQTYQQGNSLASTTSGFATGGSIKIDLVTGNAADGSGANWTVGNYKEFSFDGNVLLGTVEQPGTEFFVNDAVSYQKEDAVFTNANGQVATELVLNGNESVLTLESDLAQGLKIRADEAGTVVVGGEATLNAGAVSVGSGKEMSLTGDGTYSMSENANTLGAGVVLDEGGWKGTVVVNGAADALELGSLGTTGSTIKLGEADHKLATGDHTVTAKVEGAGSSLTMNGGTLTLRGTTTLEGVYGADAISATAATITNGLTVDSISGDVTVSGGMVQEKTSGEAITVNGELTLSSVTLGAVLNNGGEIVFDGRMRVDSSAMGGPTSKTILYEDNDGTEGAHGFRKIETAYTVVTGAVGAVTDNASWTVDDAIPAIYAGGKVTTIGVIDSTTYWLNANSGDYALTTAQAKLEAGNYIALNGGTLQVDTALTAGVTISSTKDDATGGTVNMNEGTELSRSNLEAAEDRKITLTGSGAYLLEGNTDLGAGVELSDAWTGTVYTGKLDAGTALDAAKLGTDGSTLWLGNRPMRRNSGGAEVVLKNLTSANVGDTVAPGALTLQAGASTTQNLEVQGMLTLGTADSSASLTANGVVTLQGLTFGHADSTMQAEALGGVSTLDVQLTEELLGNKKSGTTLTLVTLTQEGFDGAALLNGEDATGGIRSTDNRREFTLDWNEDGTILTLTVRGTETYVTEQVKPTTHNGKAGVALLTDVFLNDTPAKGGALEALLDAVDAGMLSDRDAAAVAGASAAVLGQALSGDVERQLRAIRNRSISGAYGRDAVALNNGKVGAPSMTDSNRYFAWVNAEGNRAEQNADGCAAGYTLSSWGGTVGAGMQVNNQLTLGLALTAMYGDLQSDGPDGLDGDMDTAYLSAFARYNSGNWSHAFIGTVGTMEADYKRTAMGYSNTGDTEGTSFGLMYELSRDYALSNNSSISPVFNISYRHIAVDGYSERGTDAALNVGEQSLDTVTVALGARYAAVLGQQTLNRACAFEARALAKYDFGDTQTDTNVGFINHATRSGIKSAELGAFGVELGAGISVPVGSGSIFADGAVELRSDYTNFNATVGYKIQF